MSELRRPLACAICGSEDVQPRQWFLLTENRLLNRVKILLWSDELARQPGVLAVCCAEHVQELVAHWMATGSLNYPFARIPGERRTWVVEPACWEADTRDAAVVGELSVHPESLSRLLEDNPQALYGMLEALMDGLGRRDVGPVRAFQGAEQVAVC